MRNNNLKNIIKVINTALLVSTLTLSLTACGRTDGKSDNSNNEADTAVVAVNNSDTDSMQNVNADDLSVNSDENQNTVEVMRERKKHMMVYSLKRKILIL